MNMKLSNGRTPVSYIAQNRLCHVPTLSGGERCAVGKSKSILTLSHFQTSAIIPCCWSSAVSCSQASLSVGNCFSLTFSMAFLLCCNIRSAMCIMTFGPSTYFYQSIVNTVVGKGVVLPFDCLRCQRVHNQIAHGKDFSYNETQT